MPTMYDYTLGKYDVPPPPPLPEYDHKKEAPKWDMYRVFHPHENAKLDPDTPPYIGTQPASDDKPDWRGIIKNNVIPMAKPERYNFGYYQVSGYYWFDTPDWADPFKKLAFALKMNLKISLCASALYAFAYNVGSDRRSIAMVIRGPFQKLFLGSMTASLVVMSLANLRGQKDDMYNWAWAGLAAGSVAGRKNYVSFIRQVCAWTPGCLAVKYANETNMKIVPIRDPRDRNHGMYLAQSGEHGFFSGDFGNSLIARYGSRHAPRDPSTSGTV